MFKVSVIIPTFKDWERLGLCLNALSHQSFSPYLFEIIVVNNAPNDSIPASFVYPINSKFIQEKKSGSYAARNTALKIANGEIIGFTDSDCIPDKDWIKNAVEFLEKNTSVSRVTGPVKIFSKNLKPSAVELYDSVYAFPQKDYVKNGAAVTANLFAYKKVFSAVGGFDSHTLSGGDLEWGFRAHEKGYKIDYCEKVLVNHPARDSFKSLFEKAKRVGKGKVILEPFEKRKLEHLRDYVLVFKPNLGEVKRILFLEKGLNVSSRLYLLILRHMILWTSDFWQLNSSKEYSRMFPVSKQIIR